jgi:hypothetical protein
VWILAHQGLFQLHGAVGEIAGVIIDEGFWQARVWPSKPGRGLTLNEIAEELARAGFVTGTGKPYATAAVAKMIEA